MRVMRRSMVGVARAMVTVGIALGLEGCANFFPPITPTPTPTPGQGSTGNYVYVANQTAKTISGFVVGTTTPATGAGVGTLAAVSGSPYGLATQPAALVVTPNNNFLYVASGIDIYAYSIGSGGVLTANSGGAVGVTDVGAVSMDVSPDGQWLFALSADQSLIYEFAINASTGALTLHDTLPYVPKSGTVFPQMIKVAPNGAYVFAALGTGGDVVFPFNTSTGAADKKNYQQLVTGSATTADNALAVDSTTSYLYIARSGATTGVAVYGIGANGVLTPVTGSPFAAGQGPYAVLLDSTGKYVYAANRTDGSISEFSIGAGGVLTALAGSPIISGTGVTSLARDNAGKYVLAVNSGGSPDVAMFSFDATTAGKLDQTTTAVSGVDPAGSVVVAATH